MFPRSPNGNITHRTYVEAAVVGNGDVAFPSTGHCSYIFNLSSGKPSVSERLISIFHPVSHVLALGSQPKVDRITARTRVSALVKDDISIWNMRAVTHNPSHPVGVHGSIRTCLASKGGCSIPIGFYIGLPRPAFIQSSYFNVGPESFLKRDGNELRKNFLRDRFRAHSVSSLIVCHALGCSNNARAFTF